MTPPSLRIYIRLEADAIRAILECGRFCDALGLRPDEKSRVTTAVSELARNIIKYAGSGRILVEERSRPGAIGIEVTAVDRGPGIPDLDQALEDHFSSGGTLGLGLPGVKRLMDDFEIASTLGEGTRVTACLWKLR